MNDSSWMSQIAGKYKTQNTIVGPAGGGIFRCLLANPRRYFVSFSSFTGVAVAMPFLPGPLPEGMTASSFFPSVNAFKFSDCPSLLQGEWYYFDDNIARFIITECLYTGD